jgi:drug/metabolite transporter (DMT)-like permease
MSSRSSQSWGYLYALLTLLIWSSFVVMSKWGGQQGLTPFDVTALRVSAAALCLLPWWLPRLLHAQRRRLPLYQTLTLAALAGVSYPLIAYTGFLYAPASHGAVLIAGLLPLSTTILSYWLLHEWFSAGKLAGLLLMVCGALLLLGQAAHPEYRWSIVGDVILIGAGVVWAIFTVLIRYWKASAFDVTLAVAAASALFYLPIYLLFLPKHWHMVTPDHLLYQALFQGVLVVCVAMWTYGKATEILGSTQTVMLLSTVPVVGSAMSVLWLGEPLTTALIMGALLTTTGALIGAYTSRLSAPLSGHTP